MTVERARLEVLRARLTQQTPAPLEGQQTIDDVQPAEGPEPTADAPTQPPLWT